MLFQAAGCDLGSLTAGAEDYEGLLGLLHRLPQRRILGKVGECIVAYVGAVRVGPYYVGLYAAEYYFCKAVQYLLGSGGCESCGDFWFKFFYYFTQLQIGAAECVAPLAYCVGLVYNYVEYVALLHFVQHPGGQQYLRVCYDYFDFALLYSNEDLFPLLLGKAAPENQRWNACTVQPPFLVCHKGEEREYDKRYPLGKEGWQHEAQGLACPGGEYHYLCRIVLHRV